MATAKYWAAVRRAEQEWDKPGYGDWGVIQEVAHEFDALPRVVRVWLCLRARCPWDALYELVPNERLYQKLLALRSRSMRRLP